MNRFFWCTAIFISGLVLGDIVRELWRLIRKKKD